jgi:transposase
MTVLLHEHGTRLREINGVGPVLAARLLGRTGSPKRFASTAAYANYTATAPSKPPAPIPPSTGCPATKTGN